jgi:hypothetical protein
MTLLLLRLWPALIPVVFYIFWHHRRKKRHLAEGKDIPAFFDGPWVQSFSAALAIAIIMLVIWRGVEGNPEGKSYQPARLENGKLVPAELK